VWSNQSHREVLLPLRERLLACLFNNLESAYAVLTAAQATLPLLPRLDRLLPDLDLQLCDP
jgi:hypothetical protein